MQIFFVGKGYQERQSERSLAPYVAFFSEAAKVIIKIDKLQFLLRLIWLTDARCVSMVSAS